MIDTTTLNHLVRQYKLASLRLHWLELRNVPAESGEVLSMQRFLSTTADILIDEGGYTVADLDKFKSDAIGGYESK